MLAEICADCYRRTCVVFDIYVCSTLVFIFSSYMTWKHPTPVINKKPIYTLLNSKSSPSISINAQTLTAPKKFFRYVGDKRLDSETFASEPSYAVPVSSTALPYSCLIIHSGTVRSRDLPVLRQREKERERNPIVILNVPGSTQLVYI